MGSKISKEMEMKVRKEDIGRVIGKGGSVLRSIESQSGAHVSIDRTALKIRVTSDDAKTTGKAVALINRIINPPTLKIDFDPKLAGKIIGPHGRTVKRIEKESQAKMSVEARTGTITIMADTEARVRLAENIILSIIYPPKIILNCDSKYFGRIIGPGGSTIKRIQNQTSTNISLDKSRNTIEIVGEEEIDTRRARAMIAAIVQAPSVQISCPREVLGQIIGNRGEHIKSVQNETRTSIEILESNTPGPVKLKITSSNNQDLSLASKLLQDEIKAAMKAPDYTGKEGAKLRKEASEWAVKREHLFALAHEMYENDKRKDAKRLSEEGKRAGQKLAECNARASAAIFNHLNEGKGLLYIDLHGQFVEEALSLLRERLSLLLRNGHDDRLECIVGAGHHSKNHVARIKPAVHKLIKKMNLHYDVDNAGKYTIYA